MTARDFLLFVIYGLFTAGLVISIRPMRAIRIVDATTAAWRRCRQVLR